MATCPHCNTDLGDQDFGLITCPGCAASLMIDIDGTVESSQVSSSSEQIDSPVEPNESASTPDSEAAAEEFSGFEFADQLLDELDSRDSSGGEADRMLQDPENWQTEGVDESSDAEPEGFQAGLTSSSYATGEIPDLGEGTSQMDPLKDSETEESGELEAGHTDEVGLYDESVESSDEEDSSGDVDQEPEEYEDITAGSEEDFEDSGTVVNVGVDDHYDGSYESGDEVGQQDEASVSEIGEYANSDASQKGAIRYDLSIGHIDSKEVRQEVRRVLADKRLMIDVDEVFSGIKDGQVVIDNLPAVKTYVVLSQLIGIAVSLKWSQRVEANP